MEIELATERLPNTINYVPHASMIATQVSELFPTTSSKSRIQNQGVM